MSSDLSDLSGKWIILCISLFLLFPVSQAFATNNPPHQPADSVVSRLDYRRLKDVLLRVEMVRRSKVFLGMAYRYGGKTPETGFDCSGLTSYIMGLFHIPLSSGSRYQMEAGRPVPLEQVRPGDLILFRRARNRPISHVAMVVDNTDEGIFIIHSTSRGIVIDNLDQSTYWRPKVVGARDVVSGSLDLAGWPPREEVEGDDEYGAGTIDPVDLVGLVLAMAPGKWW
jgi:cell wall-associated NlpC family hydrolase